MRWPYCSGERKDDAVIAKRPLAREDAAGDLEDFRSGRHRLHRLDDGFGIRSRRQRFDAEPLHRVTRQAVGHCYQDFFRLLCERFQQFLLLLGESVEAVDVDAPDGSEAFLADPRRSLGDPLVVMHEARPLQRLLVFKEHLQEGALLSCSNPGLDLEAVGARGPEFAHYGGDAIPQAGRP